MGKITLTYFDAAGRGEPIRLAFKMGNVEFEDRRIALSDPSYKDASPSGKLPVLEVDGKKYIESLPILMYAGRVTGLVPSDPKEMMKVMQIIHYPEDIRNYTSAIVFGSDEAAKTKARKACESQCTKYFTNLEKILKESFSKGYAVGGNLTVADLSVYNWYQFAVSQSFGVVVPNLPKYSLMKEIWKTVKDHPKYEPFTPTLA